MLNNSQETEVYSFKKDSLILRDLLATDRTFLANERTLLAYIRTALSLIVAGSSFIKFTDNLAIEIIGMILIPFGTIIGILGLIKFIKTNKDLKKIKNASNYNID
ncbi:hypothetical protein SH1V18_06190 [Vallitalea longa]|uniref:DUF202 domain-containing protein n=1 Tax=Vallitalea longa TaxID=2936439 RepID=A0A9W5Y823_9FIRM|nr:DUF202 domain-containing protein [Vallitalea longa]GKX28139.1 hypothetical protein SH1V18_06190 [Vallitalea longa]